jgi:tetratricopeptide (TPR) repeat protein
LARARALLGELSHAHLLAETAPGRFTLHDLLRAYATELAQSRETKAGRHTAQRRLLDHFVHTAYAATRLLNPHMQPIALSPPEPGAVPRDLADAAEARAWFDVERTTLLATVDRAAGTGFDTHAWQLARTLMTYLDRQGYWHEWVASQGTALAAAQRLSDPVALAQTHRGLGRAYAQLGRLEEALSHLGQALERHRAQDDPLGQAQCHLDLAMICLRQERLTDALEHDRAALDLYRTAGDPYGQANALNAIGWCHGLMGDYLPALARCHEALPLLVEIGNRAAQADTWDTLGYIHHQLGAFDDAAECYLRAIDLYHDIGNRHPEAETLTSLGDTYQLAGHREAARGAWERAASILDELGHASAAQVLARLAELDRLPGPVEPSG